MMKKSFVVLLIISLACSSKKVDSRIDCTQSDIELILSETSSPDCQNLGAITVAASGGVGEYLYKLNGTNEQVSATFSGLSGGVYLLSVSDANGCSATVDVTLTADDGSVAGEVKQLADAGCGGSSGQIGVTASGGTGEYVFSLDGGAETTDTSFSQLSAGEHSVKITDDEGCSTTLITLVVSGTSLKDDIMPIIMSNCAIGSDCHGLGQGDRPIFQNNKSGVIKYAAHIKRFTQSGSMPPEESLSQNQIDLIACWVDDGAKDN